MRIGIIGSGRHGSRYATHIHRGEIPGLTLAAICRRSTEGRQQAAGWGCDWHAEWKDLVRSPKVDAVITAVPPVLNLPIARLAAEAGKHVLIEKPLATNVTDALAILEACGHAGIKLTVGHTLRYNTVVNALRREISRAGKLHAFHASQRLEPIVHPWLDNPELAGAGVILQTAVHIFDTLRFITGKEFLRVRALTSQRHNRKLEDLFFATVEMEDDLSGSIDVSKVGFARTNRYEFVGHEGELQGEVIHNHLSYVHGTSLLRLDAGPPVVATIVPLLSDWQRYLAGAGSNPISGEDGYAAVAVAEAALVSAKADQWKDVQRIHGADMAYHQPETLPDS